MKIFDGTASVDEINAYLRGIATNGEFSEARHAVFFKPGTYGSAAGENDPSTATGIINSQVGYYTSIHGLGASPDDVLINGALHVNPSPGQVPNALVNFWRTVGNLSINPIQRPVPGDSNASEQVAKPHTMRWNVSQGSPLRRVHIKGDLDLNGMTGSYAFGSELVNSKIDGTVDSGDSATELSVAQWYSRDSEIGGWRGDSANLVFSGVHGAPATTFAPGGTTSLDRTPVSREAPFLYLSGDRYEVFVPNVARDTAGVRWSTSTRDGRKIPIGDFFIAKPQDSVTAINAALAGGKNLMLTPGVYNLKEPIRVTRANTVVMGMGYASLAPIKGTAAIEVADVAGVSISGLTVDAGPVRSDVLVKIGTFRGLPGEPRNPTSLSDVFIRVGGPRAGSAATSIEINSSHVIVDSIWLWRGDHGTGTLWHENKADHGLVVNGDDVTVLGLYAEHYQKYQVIWNGERGRTIFYQSEYPYDVPSQQEWTNGTKNGYASYVVSPHVKTHQATGLAIYAFFRQTPARVTSAIEAPRLPGVRFASLVSAIILGQGGVDHVINTTGEAVDAARPNSPVVGLTALTRLKSYPPGR
ncbi:adenylyl cyclase [Nonomuraea bangladeshensis]